ncbi:hypothetical protein CDAR_51911 [Caerostris darwini]|uniref:Uncharacterized protein n=1 Tax=Caerostris darwini TaxID=1538125 RepID=A0AAV4X4W6_9ARAC|nr:hypothetical protein CDAR_51911 [Caerostris darwini]
MTSERWIQRSTKRFERNLLISSTPFQSFLHVISDFPFHTSFPFNAQSPSNRKIPVRSLWKKSPGVNNKMLQVSFTVFLRGQRIQNKGCPMLIVRERIAGYKDGDSPPGSLVITEDEPLLHAITSSSSDCFMEMLMSVKGSGIVTLSPLDEIEETDHLLQEKILLFLKVSFYSYWECTYIFFISERQLHFSECVNIERTFPRYLFLIVQFLLFVTPRFLRTIQESGSSN